LANLLHEWDDRSISPISGTSLVSGQEKLTEITMEHKQFDVQRAPRRNILLKIISLAWVKKEVIVESIALYFVILFLYTGITKLMEFDVFQEQLSESPILEPVASVTALGIPAVEFIISIMLFIPRFRSIGLYATLTLMIAFTIYVIALVSFSTQLPCSCGGIMEELSWQGHLVFNCASILLAFVAIGMQRRLIREKNFKK
jgi:uncharacterized membrane protein YphA (DoxX/SURF4 family)